MQAQQKLKLLGDFLFLSFVHLGQLRSRNGAKLGSTFVLGISVACARHAPGMLGEAEGCDFPP